MPAIQVSGIFGGQGRNLILKNGAKIGDLFLDLPNKAPTKTPRAMVGITKYWKSLEK